MSNVSALKVMELDVFISSSLLRSPKYNDIDEVLWKAQLTCMLAHLNIEIINSIRMAKCVSDRKDEIEKCVTMIMDGYSKLRMMLPYTDSKGNRLPVSDEFVQACIECIPVMYK